MTVYYCSWATGNDTTGDGSAGTPWKTITKATTSRSAGDEIRVEKSPDPTALTGTVGFTLNSTAVTGVGTAFTTELAVGDFISAPDGQYYEVITLTSDTAAVLYKKYPSATQSGFASSKLGVTDTGAAAGSGTQIQVVSASGSAVAFLYISGGWDLSTEEQTGQTYFRQIHSTFANRYGYGLYLNAKTYVNIDKLNFLRYNGGIFCDGGGNNVITNATCSSNLDGVIFWGSNYNVISATCNSNDVRGIYYESTNFNIITKATCNSNSQHGIYYNGTSCSNIITNATCNSNSQHGIYYNGTSTNNIVTKATCNSNGYYGICYNPTSINNSIYLLSTANNSSGSIFSNTGINTVHNATIEESTKVDTGTNYLYDIRLNINNLGGYSYIYSNYATANSQEATAGGTGKEWKLAVTNAARNSAYPFYIPIARFAVASSGQVTVTLYFKKSHATSIAGALRCRYGQVAWSDSAADIVVACPDNTSRNQVTLQFTPTEAGVVEVEALAWYVSATDQNVIIDDIAISQA